MSFAWLPNGLCVLRILLAAPTAYALYTGRYELTLLLFAIAAISDGLDGWLAKHFGWSTRLGKILDPIADKILLVTVFVTLVWIGLVPIWLAVAAVLRDVIIVLGAASYTLFIGHVEGHPTRVSKLNTLLQLCFGLGVIADAAWDLMAPAFLMTLGAATFVTTVVSGLDYILTYARDAVRDRRAALAGIR